MSSISWSNNPANRIDAVKKYLSRLSLVVRREQLQLLVNLFHSTSRQTVLDLGLSPREELPDTNYFEKHYPYPGQITGASVENCRRLSKKYGLAKIVRVAAGRKLPFRTGQFDLATSWATLEHVGDYQEQEFFLNELLRVGKHIWVTTPYRYCIYEPHTGFFFLHWIPLSWFRLICRLTGRQFWTRVTNLNPLAVRDIQRMQLVRPVYVQIYKTWGWLPTHLLITDVPV